ncbi:carbonic anhydrase 2 isoform X2 [Calliphora vicina]|uniref:carbonic anhydrase 2 isoform X2 n=1 Tax=Calliphora vicina TaxID=7373 RepID=UPI00325B12CC
MIAFLFLFLACLCLTVSSASASEEHWGYPDYSKNEEFPHWGGMCDKGKRQSPINLSLRGAVKGVYDKLEGENYDKTITQAALVNTGHSVQLFNFDLKLKLRGGPLKNDYVLEQAHFHWWSEHTIDNIRYPFEMHMVHRNVKYENMTVAAQHKDGITVVGVLYHASMERNEAIDDILDDFEKIKDYDDINKPINIETNFEIEDLLPEIKNYIIYEGSLTTPTCAEAVTWIIMAETYPVTIDQVEAFKALQYDQGKNLINNYRAIQETNNRAIIVASNDNRSGAAAFTLQTSLISLVFMVLCAKYLY